MLMSAYKFMGNDLLVFYRDLLDLLEDQEQRFALLCLLVKPSLSSSFAFLLNTLIIRFVVLQGNQGESGERGEVGSPGPSGPAGPKGKDVRDRPPFCHL